VKELKTKERQRKENESMALKTELGRHSCEAL
jgi:hypothetical protein